MHGYRYCPKCKEDDQEFYSSINHMCADCWREYQRDQRIKRLKDKPLEHQGRPIDPVRELIVEGVWESGEEASAYLAGVIDGEGHIQFYPYGGKSVQITNTDKGIISAAAQALNTLGVSYKLRQDQRYSKKLDKKYKDCYTLYIYRQENFRVLQEKVPLKSVKREKLNQMIASYKVKNTKRNRPSVYEVSGGDALSTCSAAAISGKESELDPVTT